MASFTKLKTKKGGWQAYVRRKGMERKKNFRTKFDAETWAREIEREIDSGRVPELNKAAKLSFGDALTQFIEEQSKDRMQQEGKTEAKKTRIEKQRRDRHTKQRMLKSQFQKYNAPLSHIITADITDFRRSRLDQAKPSGKKISAHTVNNDLNLISSVFKYARSEWGMDNLNNPVKGSSRPKVADERNICPYEWEMENIIAAVDDYKPHLLWFKPMVLFQAAVGLRAGETANIEESDINLDKRTITLNENKTNYAREIPVCTKGMAVLESFEWGTPRVFSVSSNQFSNEWAKFRDYLGAKNLIEQNIRLHDLRHYALTQYFKLKTPDGFPALQIHHVQLISGHETLDVLFNTYVKKRDPADVTSIPGF